jgi:cellulose synthase/poly-beta-1,6-N-acetylglucosamine synthase-like glycosyltransferase
MRISYAIPVCNEHKELDRLLAQLLFHETPDMEVVVQCDQGNTSPEVYKVLDKYSAFIYVIEFPLKGNFAAFKNNLKEHCTGAWIFQIDADEYLSESLIKNLPHILQSNPTVDLFLVPRINTVEGLTQEHINKWQWRVDEKGWVNFPDYQTRILQNSPKINWVSKVHEVLTGHNSYVMLPAEEGYCLYHPKGIERQERQNNFYSAL